jgi:hypothetical protein
MPVADQVHKVYLMCTRDLAGRHFTERYTPGEIAALERLGLIAVFRPTWSQGPISWEVEVTRAGLDLLEEYPEYLPD